MPELSEKLEEKLNKIMTSDRGRDVYKRQD